MFLGLREHEMRSNPWHHGGKKPFDPNIILYNIRRICHGVKKDP